MAKELAVAGVRGQVTKCVAGTVVIGGHGRRTPLGLAWARFGGGCVVGVAVGAAVLLHLGFEQVPPSGDQCLSGVAFQ